MRIHIVGTGIADQHVLSRTVVFVEGARTNLATIIIGCRSVVGTDLLRASSRKPQATSGARIGNQRTRHTDNGEFNGPPKSLFPRT